MWLDLLKYAFLERSNFITTANFTISAVQVQTLELDKHT